MKKVSSGFSLVEILMAVSIFGLVATALSGGLIYGQQSTALSGARSRATILADEGLEAVRNMRDENFSNLADGSYGLIISGGQWILSGSSDTTDIFSRQITISTPTTNRRQIVATVNWPQNIQRNGSVVLTTYLTNWRASSGGGGTPVSCTTYCLSLSLGYTAGTCRQNSQQCTNNGEVHQIGGDLVCVANFPGDASRDTCCCHP